MKVLYSILIFIASLILSGGIVYLINVFGFSNLSSGTGAMAETLLRFVINGIMLIILTAIFNMLGHTFLF